MITVIAKLSLKPGKLSVFIEAWAELVQEYLKEPACHAFNVFVDKKNENVCYVIGKWDDEEAYQYHLESPAYKRAYTYSIGWLTREPETTICREVI
ncbi:MAG: putative quinol monooxygenase [Syntrophomonadaceae bacterium]